jgi:ferric-dicitrate binding protein FerR (iron transport regulator)
MTTEDKIKRWLAGELSDAERKEFESSKEFSEIQRLLKALKSFKAPEYDVDGQYSKLSEEVIDAPKTISLYNRISPVLRIAAIFIVALTIGYFSYDQLNSSMKNQEWIVAQDEVILPDSSVVLLNAESKIRFSHKQWKKERNVELRGEAFFKVNTGSTFNVISLQGTVSVLGTEFSVKDWNNYFEVACYSGMVNVITAQKAIVLEPGSAFRIMDKKEEQYSLSVKSEPDWLHGESSFSSVPLHLVLKELERQYQVNVVSNNIDLNEVFTGSFTHADLGLALESITIPLGYNYEIQEDKIVILLESK